MSTDWLDEQFEKLVECSFKTLRNKYYDGDFTKADAVELQALLEAKLSMKDPDGEIPEEDWRYSNSCEN